MPHLVPLHLVVGWAQVEALAAMLSMCMLVFRSSCCTRGSASAPQLLRTHHGNQRTGGCRCREGPCHGLARYTLVHASHTATNQPRRRAGKGAGLMLWCHVQEVVVVAWATTAAVFTPAWGILGAAWLGPASGIHPPTL